MSEPIKHTPLPWYFGLNAVGKESSSGEPDKLIALCEGENELGDAQFIVRACNAHYELLEACKALQMEAASRNCGLKIADDAIAKAEGTKS